MICSAELNLPSRSKRLGELDLKTTNSAILGVEFFNNDITTTVRQSGDILCETDGRRVFKLYGERKSVKSRLFIILQCIELGAAGSLNIKWGVEQKGGFCVTQVTKMPENVLFLVYHENIPYSKGRPKRFNFPDDTNSRCIVEWIEGTIPNDLACGVLAYFWTHFERQRRNKG